MAKLGVRLVLATAVCALFGTKLSAATAGWSRRAHRRHWQGRTSPTELSRGGLLGVRGGSLVSGGSAFVANEGHAPLPKDAPLDLHAGGTSKRDATVDLHVQDEAARHPRTEEETLGNAKATFVKQNSATASGIRSSLRVRGGMIASLVSRLFAIPKHELGKFLYMSLMMFAIIYIFTMTRDTKDALIVTNCGAEAIAFLKVYAVLPAAALFMIGYNWLSNRVGGRALFHLTITPFLVFYTAFAFLMYPMRGALHHSAGALGKDEHVFSHMINIGRFWMFSLYYVVSELWGSAGVPLLFWTCANEVTPIAQAKRFYPLFAILGNLGPIASGQTMAYVSRNRPADMDADAAFERTLKILTALIVGAGGTVMFLYEVVMGINRAELAASEEQMDAGERRVTAKDKRKAGSKPQMGLMDSFRFLSKSKYLGYVGLVVVSYGLSMEFTEIVWKAIVKLAFPDKSDYMAFMGQYSTIVGAATFLMLLVGKEVIKYLGWEVGALATPVMMAVLAVPFFGYITLGNIQQSRKTLMLAVWVGMVQNVLSKATKYALFDPTKEMAYIPLDKESKVKGKAAIDVLGARLGKSGGALAQQGLVVVCGSILTGAPFLATLFAMVSAMWITSVVRLSKLFRLKQAESEEAALQVTR